MTNVHLHPGEETLMAFADGELEEDVAVAVEQAMTNDPALVRELVGFTRCRRLAKAAMSHGYGTGSAPLISAVSALASSTDDGSNRGKAQLGVVATALPQLGGGRPHRGRTCHCRGRLRLLVWETAASGCIAHPLQPSRRSGRVGHVAQAAVGKPIAHSRRLTEPARYLSARRWHSMPRL